MREQRCRAAPSSDASAELAPIASNASATSGTPHNLFIFLASFMDRITLYRAWFDGVSALFVCRNAHLLYINCLAENSLPS